MTTIPGHNILLQQSGTAQEMTHQNTSKPSPEQAAAMQEAQGLVKKTTVQGLDESDHLKSRNKKDARKKRQMLERKKKKQDRTSPDSDAPGRLLDTTA